MRPLQEWLDEYSENHQNPINKIIHWICIPAILLSVVSLLVAIPDPFVSEFLHWGTVFLLFLVIYYLLLSWRLALGMLVVCVCLLIVTFALNMLPLPLWLSGSIIFVLAWLGQFYGHKVEGKKPSFFKDLNFLLIGPLWLLAYIYRHIGIRY
ncbi:MAG TPA: Mpo1-like protein [Thermodesulfobacteriota bacterium]|nr:Mpo1-like protein [Thermodesulfobacteriota bacterium]